MLCFGRMSQLWEGRIISWEEAEREERLHVHTTELISHRGATNKRAALEREPSVMICGQCMCTHEPAFYT